MAEKPNQPDRNMIVNDISSDKTSSKGKPIGGDHVIKDEYDPKIVQQGVTAANDYPKKKSAFQITSVKPASLNEDGDSMDDLDESHTEDVSSLDLSKTTDIDPDPSSPETPSNATVNNEDLQLPSQNISSSNNKVTDDTNQNEDKPDDKVSTRFRVVKIESKEPFIRGRWKCFDFLDPPLEKNDLKLETDKDKEQGSGNSSAASSIHYVHGEDDPSKNPLSGTVVLQGVNQQVIVASPTRISVFDQGQFPLSNQNGQSQHGAVTAEIPTMPNQSLDYHSQQATGPQALPQAQKPATVGHPNSASSSQHPLPSTQQSQTTAVPGQTIQPNTVPSQPGGHTNQTGQPNTDYRPPTGQQQIPVAMAGGQQQQMSVQTGQQSSDYRQAQPTGQQSSDYRPAQPTGQQSSDYRPAQPAADYKQTPAAGVQGGQSTTEFRQSQAEHSASAGGVSQTEHSQSDATNSPTQQTVLANEIANLNPPALSSGGGNQSSSLRKRTQNKSERKPMQAVNTPLMINTMTGIPDMSDVATTLLVTLGTAAAATTMSPRADSPTTMGKDSEGAEGTGSSTVAIDNKIEQAMDLVKSHLMFAVREEVEVLKEQIKELIDTNKQLVQENQVLRQNASPETIATLGQQRDSEDPPTTTS